MANERVTVCLTETAAADVAVALDAALAPYDQNKISEAGSEWRGEWDSWRIHGGDGESGLPVLAGHENDPRLVWVPAHVDGTPRPRKPSRCDGGPRELLDFGRDRSVRARTAREQWIYWNSLVERFPEARSLRYFFAKHNADPSHYSMGEARRDHADQPVLRAFVRERHPDVSHVFWHELNDPVENFSLPMNDYIRREVATVIPTEALLTLDGRWTNEASFGDSAAGRDRFDKYCNFADHYLEELASDALIVRVLFHS